MIKCTQLAIEGLLLFESKLYEDSRGSFSEVFKQKDIFEFLPSNIEFVQENESISRYGVLRGMHFQINPCSQSKLIRVACGAIQDVVVDVRKDSPTFGQHLSIDLSKDNRRQLFVPKGFAHGFLSLSDNTIVNYKVDNYYSVKHESGLLFSDPDLNIKWKIDSSDVVVSEKDLKFPKLKKSLIQ